MPVTQSSHCINQGRAMNTLSTIVFLKTIPLKVRVQVRQAGVDQATHQVILS